MQKLYRTLMENLSWLLYHGLESAEDGAVGPGGPGSNVGSGRRNQNSSGRGRGSGRGSGRGNNPPPGTTFSQQHLLRTLQNKNLENREKL